MNKFYVYMLVTKRKNNLLSYVGYTKNLRKRLFLHNNSKGAKFTKGYKWTLAYSKLYSSKSRAMKEEYSLKHDIKKRRKIKHNFFKNENSNTTSL
tara:strand:+ start:285 stop:569 length:285 start_codon:yes stop_codon:yes gene_type:complete